MLLGLDGGGSGSRWGLFDQGGTLRQQGRGPALTGHVFTPEDERALRGMLSGLAAQLPARPDRLVAGVSGLQVSAVPLIRAALAEVFGVPPEHLRLTDDLELAYAAHFAPGQGLLVYAGTGSVAYFHTPGGEVRRAGGHGFLLGDEGGAFWQGREALRALLRVQDGGRVPSGPLAEGLAALTGGLEWPVLRGWVYRGGRAGLASLAPAVERAALAGDAAAQDVGQRAGEALAGLARTLAARCPAGLPLVLAGGAAGQLVRAAFSAALPDAVQHAPVSPLLGAPRLWAAAELALWAVPP